MTLLEKTYKDLRSYDVVSNAEHFSVKFLNRSRSWYAVQTHEQRDFSTAAAIQCLRSIRNELTVDGDNAQRRKALEMAAVALLEHLNKNHSISNVI